MRDIVTVTQSTEVSIPKCYNYFRAIDTPRGQATKTRLERHAKRRIDIPPR
jgi:hypothetical protein